MKWKEGSEEGSCHCVLMGQNQVTAYPLKEVSCMSSGSNKCFYEFFGQG